MQARVRGVLKSVPLCGLAELDRELGLVLQGQMEEDDA